MTNAGTFEAKNRPFERVEPAARGEENVITQPGEQVANLTSASSATGAGKLRRWAARVRKSRDAQPLGDRASIRHLIEEGRR